MELTAATKKGRPIKVPSIVMDLANILNKIGSPHILPMPSTIWANPNVLALVSSSVHAVTRDSTATRVPYPVAKNRTANMVIFISFTSHNRMNLGK